MGKVCVKKGQRPSGALKLTWDKSLLFLALLVVSYTWLGYPVLLWIIRRFFATPVTRGEEKPFVSVILAVHNEQEAIAEKLQDCQRILYPDNQMEVLVVSDHSTDATEEIVERFATRDARIRLLRSEGRVGKSGVQNQAAQTARGEILFFTDANTRTSPDILQVLVSNFADPRTGLVTATVHFGQPTDAVTKGQGLYWRYELYLREAESDIGILATASGQAMAVRREIVRPIPPIYGEDCILPLDVRLQNCRVLHDSRAVVFDTMPHTIAGELRARIRMTARNWTGTLSRPAILNPFRFPLTSFGLLSHKLLRWLTPFLLAIAFAANTVLVLDHQQTILWVIQLLFYLSALVGWMLARGDRSAGVFAYPFSFCLANLGFFLGMVRAFRNQRITAY